nr:MAG TPA: Plasmid replication region DNA-binding N-term [Caudoviricetes sp.]
MMTVTFEGSAAEVLSEMQVFLKNTAAPKGSTVEVTPEKVTIASTAAPQISKVKIPDSAPKAAKSPAVPVQAPTVPVQSPTVPVAPAKEYTQAEILAACGPLMDAGKVPELTQIIQEFGVASMMEIPQEKYGELAVRLRALGAKL